MNTNKDWCYRKMVFTWTESRLTYMTLRIVIDFQCLLCRVVTEINFECRMNSKYWVALSARRRFLGCLWPASCSPHLWWKFSWASFRWAKFHSDYRNIFRIVAMLCNNLCKLTGIYLCYHEYQYLLTCCASQPDEFQFFI